jgi:hypothetical protein
VDAGVRAAITSPTDELKPLVQHLAALRKLRGEIISLGEVRYVEAAVVADLVYTNL